MKWILGVALAGALSSPTMWAEDKHKEEVKFKTKDAVTGDTIKHKSKTKVESDGQYKTKSQTKVNGETVEKREAKMESDGDYKEKVKTKDGKYETKVDK